MSPQRIQHASLKASYSTILEEVSWVESLHSKMLIKEIWTYWNIGFFLCNQIYWPASYFEHSWACCETQTHEIKFDIIDHAISHAMYL